MSNRENGGGRRQETRAANPIAAYWDENREKSRDPQFWMAHPLCRASINRRVSGSEHEWPLDWFKRVYVPQPFRRGVTWGCGLGAFERSAIRLGVVEEMDAFDISPASLKDAEKAAAGEGISAIHYRLGDFNDPRIPEGVDIAFFHASLHHVARLERLFRTLAASLPPRGAVYVDEYVGPSRTDWRWDHLAQAQALLDQVPSDARVAARIELPIEAGDPSEAIRSSEIVGFLKAHLDLAALRPYGGQLADLLFPYLTQDWTGSDAGRRFVAELLAREDEEIAREPERSHHVVAYGHLRPAAVRSSSFFRRLFRRS